MISTDRIEALQSTCLIALLLATAMLFWPALSGPFVFDDFANLQNLEQINGEIDRHSIGRYLYYSVGAFGRPLSTLSFLIEDWAWPTDPASFKRNNLLFHLLCGILVFALARQLSGALQIGRTKAIWIGLGCATAWLIHPMQLSSTMLIVQRANILSTMFMLAGLTSYIRLLEANQIGERSRVLLATASLGAFSFLAFACKENGILLFAYAAAVNFTLLHERVASLNDTNRRLIHTAIMLPVIAMAGALILNFEQIHAGYKFREFTLFERVITQPRVLIEYLSGILLPRIGGQGLFHENYIASTSITSPISTLYSITAIMGLIAAAFLARHRSPLFSFAVLFFLAGHLIESTVISLEMYFVHRNYMPMLGPLFALVVIAFSSTGAWKKIALMTLSVWIILAAGMTWISAKTWADRGLMAHVWFEENQTSLRAIQNLASFYFDSGDTASARRLLSHGMETLPDKVELRFQVILLDCQTTGIMRDEWDAALSAAKKAKLGLLTLRTIRGLTANVVQDNCKETISHDDTATLIGHLISNPNYAQNRATIGYLHYELSKLARSEMNFGELMQHLELAYEYTLNPLLLREQAVHFLSAGLPDEAIKALDLSESARIPWFRAWLLDIQHYNAPLRAAAANMLLRNNGHERSPPH